MGIRLWELALGMVLFSFSFGVIAGMAARLVYDRWYCESPQENKATVVLEKRVGYSTNDLRAMVRAAARERAIPEHIALNLVTAESSWRIDAVSNKGAYGLCQVTRIAAKEMGEDPDSEHWRFDPKRNIEVGLDYLKWCYERTRDWRLALYAYNWGIGNVRRWERGELGLPISVLIYANKILEGNQ